MKKINYYFINFLNHDRTNKIVYWRENSITEKLQRIINFRLRAHKINETSVCLDYRKTGLFWTNFMFDHAFCEVGLIYRPANCTDFLMWVPSFRATLRIYIIIELIFSKKTSNIPQRKFCIIENWEFENVNEHVWKFCILDMRWTSRGIEIDVQRISRIQDFQTCSFKFTFSNSQFSIIQNFLCGIFEIFFEKINSMLIPELLVEWLTTSYKSLA